MSTSGDMVIELNFVPEWARRPADQHAYARFEDRHRAHDKRGGDDQDRRNWKNKSDSPGQRRAGAPSRQARRGDLRSSQPQNAPAPSGTSGRTGRFERADNRYPPIKVTFIPERRGLKPLVARLARSGRAYPLFEVATLFLSKPDFYAVKLELIPGMPGGENTLLYQCAECHLVFLDRNQAVAHVLNKHIGLFYAQEETQIDPPKGNFICVARCKLSGELIGPPNYHEFNDRVMELHRARFAAMPLDAYRRNIVNETDQALIEQWKKEACRHVFYKTLRLAEPLTFQRRSAMEAHFLEHYAPALIRPGHRFVTPGVASRDIEDPLVKEMIEAAWVNENRFPLKMAVSIQPAFRRMGLHLFKVSGKATFVSAIVPHPIDAARADDGIRRILKCLGVHPGITRQQLVEFLQTESAPDAFDQKAVLHAVRWMVEKGHVIEFYNGTLSIPCRNVPEHAEADQTVSKSNP